MEKEMSKVDLWSANYSDMDFFSDEYISDEEPNTDGEAIAPAERAIIEECDLIKELLVNKNAKYGNSALEPIRVFSQLDSKQQLLVRIDDKLSRICSSGLETPDEDTVQDLIGYLILYRVAVKKY